MTETAQRGAVVVGMDSSREALAAVGVAAREAVARGTALKIVHAWPWQDCGPPGEIRDPRAQARVEGELAQAATEARNSAPGLIVTAHVVEGTDATVLLHEAETADLLVIGHRGLGAFAGLLAGAAGVRLAGHTGCPLMVVRPTGDPAGPVVVGIDDPQRSDGLLDTAFRQARRDRRDLVVVHAWQFPTSSAPLPGYGYDEWGTAEVEAVAGELERVRHDHLDVEVRVDVRCGTPGRVLLDVAASASLLILGSRGKGGFRNLVLGSVAMVATRHARCNVMVVPPPIRSHAPAAR
jgi:nucleotide-binding universal stress UspA family protein